MFRRKQTVFLLIVALALFAGAWASAASVLVDQNSVLSGKVHAVVGPGSAVREGDVLVVVNTIVGPSPAVRATTDGIVRDILVKPGADIIQGQTAVRIEPKGK